MGTVEILALLESLMTNGTAHRWWDVVWRGTFQASMKRRNTWRCSHEVSRAVSLGWGVPAADILTEWTLLLSCRERSLEGTEPRVKLLPERLRATQGGRFRRTMFKTEQKLSMGELRANLDASHRLKAPRRGPFSVWG